MKPTATEDPLGRSDHREGPQDREELPFTVLDEAVFALDTPAEPWSIQLELGLPGPLDKVRLRAAVGSALSRHPMARARKKPARYSDRHPTWEITPEPDLDPLRVVECADDGAVDALRAELHSLSVPLAESPPFRLRLATHPDGELLLLNVNHTAFDGWGAVRLLQSVARAYADEPDPLPEVDLSEARDVERHLAATDRDTRARRFQLLGGKVRDLALPPSRLAPDQAEDEPGYGFHHRSLTAEQTGSLSDKEASVNDLLLAALNLAVAGWNADHGARCRRVGILVPVNLRPAEWQKDVVTNLVLQARVVTDPGDRERPEAVLEAVAEQSAKIKQGGGAALIEVLGGWDKLPLWAKQPLSPLLSITGNRLVDTAILSNLGRMEPVSFGEAGEAVEAWFSAPARMPCGLSIGAVTLGERLHLAFRYRRSLFGTSAAGAFARRFLEDLDRVAAAAA